MRFNVKIENEKLVKETRNINNMLKAKFLEVEKFFLGNDANVEIARDFSRENIFLTIILLNRVDESRRYTFYGMGRNLEIDVYDMNPSNYTDILNLNVERWVYSFYVYTIHNFYLSKVRSLKNYATKEIMDSKEIIQNEENSDFFDLFDLLLNIDYVSKQENPKEYLVNKGFDIFLREYFQFKTKQKYMKDAIYTSFIKESDLKLLDIFFVKLLRNIFVKKY